MLSSHKCWSLYGQVLAKEYSDPEYMYVHALTVDAYALQHPGKDVAQANSSIYVHLLSAFAYFVKQKTLKELVYVKQQAAIHTKELRRLSPVPEPMSFRCTVADVLQAENAQQHVEMVVAWTKSVFENWEAHHTTIASLYSKLLNNCN